MAKYGPKIYASDILDTVGHWAVGTVWNAEGSKGTYNIEMLDKGFTCDCPAYKKCKHIKAVEERFECQFMQ